MAEIISTDDIITYANYFSKLELRGTRWLSYRDVPALIKKYNPDGTSALDYGCGPGKTTLLLKTLGYDADGVDINQNMIAYAKKADPNGKYTLIESGTIPEANNTYDLVFTGWVLVYISTKQELQKIIREVARVLKKNGIFVAVVTSDETFKYDWITVKTKYKENENLASGNRLTALMDNDIFLNGYYWTEEDYIEILNNSGLQTLCNHHPLGKSTDGYPWVNEIKHHSCSVFVAKKV